MNAHKKRILMGVSAALVCEILFGLSYTFTKNAMKSADEIDLLGWRFLLAFAAIALLRLCGLLRTNFRGKNLKPLILICLLNPFLYFIGETFGIARTTASESGVFLACIPVTAIAASSLILGKPPSQRQVLGIVTTLIGVIIAVLAAGLTFTFSASGYAILVLAVLAYSLYSVYVERAREFTGVEITFVMLAGGAAAFATILLIKHLRGGTLFHILTLPFTDTTFGTAVIYQGLACSMIAFFAANTAITKLGVNAASSFVGISAIVALLAGAFILGENVSFLQILGMALILLGVYIANAAWPKPSRDEGEPASLEKAILKTTAIS